MAALTRAGCERRRGGGTRGLCRQGGATGPHIAPTVQRAAGDGERAGMKERAGRSRWRVEGLGIYAYRGWKDPERDRETDEIASLLHRDFTVFFFYFYLYSLFWRVRLEMLLPHLFSLLFSLKFVMKNHLSTL